MHDLTGFQRNCLYVIAGLTTPKGLAIKAELDEYYGAEINYDRLYPNLDTLVEPGLVGKGQIDDRTNSHTLTQAENANSTLARTGRISISALPQRTAATHNPSL